MIEGLLLHLVSSIPVTTTTSNNLSLLFSQRDNSRSLNTILIRPIRRVFTTGKIGCPSSITVERKRRRLATTTITMSIEYIPKAGVVQTCPVLPTCARNQIPGTSFKMGSGDEFDKNCSFQEYSNSGKSNLSRFFLSVPSYFFDLWYGSSFIRCLVWSSGRLLLLFIELVASEVMPQLLKLFVFLLLSLPLDTHVFFFGLFHDGSPVLILKLLLHLRHVLIGFVQDIDHLLLSS